MIDPLPAGASYDPATATMSWTPGLDQGAVYNLTITVAETQETTSVKIGVADRWDDPQNVPVVDPAIYTDPQRPMTAEQGIYPIGNPNENSPALVTCNFSLTYFIVSGEIEGSRVPSWLAVVDTEGLSVLTAWAAGKFTGETVATALTKMGAVDKVAHKNIVIPGYAAAISGELEEEMAGWKILVGPREAAHIPKYLKEWKPE